ncbi:P-loop containing nucleoside triphosphate hydrolase protein [Butyriboletus roseoflavus]|nr:P-loop containing nucleoside triphosphate hydrolase protein [Butyriboletus roseoflavus]
MASLKRKRSIDGDNNDHAFSIVPDDDQDIDIASALTSNRAGQIPLDEETEDELDEFIHDAIVKRNVKGGTHLLKKIKKKGNGKGDVGGGSFQSMGLHPLLLRALTLQGYRTPTPIQRATIPSLLATPPCDLVGMARTGSGKTLAYMIPLVQRLGGRHAHAFGTRAIILVPARELALQVIKVGKSLAKGWKCEAVPHAGDGHDDDDDSSKIGPGESLRWGLIVGGEGMDEQFEMISGNPDIIIATPGRLLHLIVEMSLSLASVQYVVFDEADRLFELGFSAALSEILARLPSSRQTLLFSATLPKTLVEFAKAGLRDPKLVRLDADSKISTDLRMAFFPVKQSEKDACLLSLLRDVIKVPFANNERSESDGLGKDSKGKGKAKVKYPTHTAPHQTLVFAATKHHVEYLSALLTAAGYAVSALYGSLVQSTRTFQMSQFLAGKTQILVVTDVAARGLDIPILEHEEQLVRGEKGWAWSFVTHNEAAYLCDLQLFLARPLLGVASHPSSVRASEEPYTQSLILGPFPRDAVDAEVEYIRTLHAAHHSLPSLRGVMDRGQSMYERSRGKASTASYKRAKEMARSGDGWAGDAQGVHPVLSLMQQEKTEEGEVITPVDDKREREGKRLAMVRAVSAFKPAETVFELGTRGKAGTANAALMKERRKALAKAVERTVAPTSSSGALQSAGAENEGTLPLEMADDEDIAAVFETANKKKGKDDYRDEEFYMSHYHKDANTEKGYSLTDGASSFAAQAHRVTFDLTGDVTVAERQRHNRMTWDEKKKKFIKGDGSGADNIKLVRTENGTRLPATYRSGRFDEWKKKAKVTIPKIGEREAERPASVRASGGRRWRHNKVSEAKPLDKLSKDYERKSRQLKKKEQSATGGESEGSQARPVKNTGKVSKKNSGKRVGGKSLRRVKSEIKTVDQIHKTRKNTEKRRVKNARPSRKSKR